MDKYVYDLLETVKAGSVPAYEHIFQMYKDSVYTLALSMLNNPQYAEDATQTTFIRVYEALPQLADLDCFEPWLDQITADESENILCIRPQLRSFQNAYPPAAYPQALSQKASARIWYAVNQNIVWLGRTSESAPKAPAKPKMTSRVKVAVCFITAASIALIAATVAVVASSSHKTATPDEAAVSVTEAVQIVSASSVIDDEETDDTQKDPPLREPQKKEPIREPKEPVREPVKKQEQTSSSVSVSSSSQNDTAATEYDDDSGSVQTAQSDNDVPESIVGKYYSPAGSYFREFMNIEDDGTIVYFAKDNTNDGMGEEYKCSGTLTNMTQIGDHCYTFDVVDSVIEEGDSDYFAEQTSVKVYTVGMTIADIPEDVAGTLSFCGKGDLTTLDCNMIVTTNGSIFIDG